MAAGFNRVPSRWANRRFLPGQLLATGFSILELLIVIAVLLVMFVMLYGKSSGSRQQKLKANCLQNLQTIHVALQLYANDHDGAFPARPGAQTAEEPLSLLVPRYTSVTAHFICPGSKDGPLPEGEPFTHRKISYAYIMGRKAAEGSELLMSDAQVNVRPKIQGQAVFSLDGKKPGNNHGKIGGNFLHCDGRAEMVPARAPASLGLTQGVTLLNPRP
jgi:type II secretory pathway pseudopilin PulG